jgi:hypothetical protein
MRISARTPRGYRITITFNAAVGPRERSEVMVTYDNGLDVGVGYIFRSTFRVEGHVCMGWTVLVGKGAREMEIHTGR